MKEELVYIGKKIIEHKYNLSEKLAERLDATHPLSTEELKEKKILKNKGILKVVKIYF